MRKLAIGVGAALALTFLTVGPPSGAAPPVITVAVSGTNVVISAVGGQLELSTVGNQVVVAPDSDEANNNEPYKIEGCGTPSASDGVVICTPSGPPNISVIGSADLDSIITTKVTTAESITVSMGASNDVFVGGPQAETVEGGDGDDTITGNSGTDILSGGPGEDVIEALDKQVDTIRCGAGVDVSKSDWNDAYPDSDCEVLARTENPNKPPTPTPTSTSTATPTATPTSSVTPTASATATGAPSAQPTQKDPDPSAVTFSSKRLRLDRLARWTRVPFSCSQGPGCAGTITIKARGKVVALGRYTAAGGTSGVADLRLNRRARMLLYKAKGKAVVSVDGKVGQSATAPVRVG